MLRYIVFICIFLLCAGCSNKEHASTIDAMHTAPAPVSQPQFKLGPEVSKPLGCTAGQRRGVDC